MVRSVGLYVAGHKPSHPVWPWGFSSLLTSLKWVMPEFQPQSGLFHLETFSWPAHSLAGPPRSPSRSPRRASQVRAGLKETPLYLKGGPAGRDSTRKEALWGWMVCSLCGCLKIWAEVFEAILDRWLTWGCMGWMKCWALEKGLGFGFLWKEG